MSKFTGTITGALSFNVEDAEFDCDGDAQDAVSDALADALETIGENLPEGVTLTWATTGIESLLATEEVDA